jgi:hypothetical protein
MSKEFGAKFQAMYPLGREAFSLAIHPNNDQFFLIDAPLTEDSVLEPKKSSGVFYTHFHKDHCPQKKFTGEIPKNCWFNKETLLLLEHIGMNTSVFNKKTKLLKPWQWETIEGLGNILPFSTSHSSIDSLGFYVQLETGQTVLFSGDIRSGNRTDRAVNTISEIVGKEGVSLFVGDATGVGKEHITQDMHLLRLKGALELAEKNMAAASIFVKAGDYGNIAFWFEEGVFEATDVYLSPGLHNILGKDKLCWLSFLKHKYGYVPPDNKQLIESLVNKKLRKKTVYLYDNCWRNQIREFPHVLINASRRDIPYKSDQVIAIFPIGFSGHSEKAFVDMLNACNPDYVALSHPPGKRSALNIDKNKLLNRRKGTIFTCS